MFAMYKPAKFFPMIFRIVPDSSPTARLIANMIMLWPITSIAPPNMPQKSKQHRIGLSIFE